MEHILAWLKARLLGWRGLGLLLALAAVVWLGLRGLPDGRLHVYFLDVGQGDAIFVLAPDGRQILIDGGPSPTALLNELGQVMPFWDRSLDLVVLTHPDADHVTGLIPLLERYHVAQVLDTSLADPASQAATWRAAVAKSGARRAVALTGMRIAAGAVTLTVLNDAEAMSQADELDGNNGSTVLRLDYGRVGFLLTGDAESPAEAQMLSKGLPLRADVLKLGHHGSNYSTSLPFLAAVSPRLAVIQVGADNRFGHPHPAVLERLVGIPVLRTDLNGRIEVTSDGYRLWARD